ncbi:hypothetical protein GXM_10356 [Nostoc sphaeroides CCNUC1]|uniref:Uncharacterized protein n=1 Tax=Nostoc sphaeroides CCNUC1 TaxID=2653204 RepID=A0A5P8WJ42_9NOSO|nr:hypothetical protein GXM_10356 [Nostoc sphaeroides CCNUC1]
MIWDLELYLNACPKERGFEPKGFSLRREQAKVVPYFIPRTRVRVCRRRDY